MNTCRDCSLPQICAEAASCLGPQAQTGLKIEDENEGLVLIAELVTTGAACEIDRELLDGEEPPAGDGAISVDLYVVD